MNPLFPELLCPSIARVAKVIPKRRTILAALVGLCLPLTRIVSDVLALPVSDEVELALLAGAYLIALIALSYPWISYKLGCRLSLISATALVCVGTANVYMRDTGDAKLVPWIVPIGICFVFVVFFCGAFTMISAVVYLRKRYWIVYREGYCQQCGYNLTGLPTTRCPECGTLFARKESVAATSCKPGLVRDPQ